MRALTLALAFGFVAIRSSAQSSTGFAVSRFEPAERGSQQFVVDSLDLRKGSAAAGVTFDYAYKPLVVYDATGAERFALVRQQAFVHASGSVVLASRLRLGLDVPFAIYQDGESAVVQGVTLAAATKPALGDVRLAADVRVVGEHGDAFSLALGMRGWLPTGSRSQLTGDGSVRIAPQVLAAGTIDVLAWAARVAVVYRSRDDAYAGRSLGSEISGAAGVGYRTRDGKLLVGPEVTVASTFGGDAKLFGSRETPAEILFGAHNDVVPNVRAGAALGAGLGHGYGAPIFRALASLEWTTSSPVHRPQTGEEPEKTPWEGYEGGGTPEKTNERPLAVVTENEIRIEEQLRFATDSAELVGDSDAVLGAVKRILDEHPEIRRLRVEGHTDAVGEPAYNDELSARRAAAVEAWLVGHGVDKDRLESAGLGSREPIDTNETEAGRAKNRRVVFKIVGR